MEQLSSTVFQDWGLPAEAHSFLALGIQIAWCLLPPSSMQSLLVSQYSWEYLQIAGDPGPP